MIKQINNLICFSYIYHDKKNGQIYSYSQAYNKDDNKLLYQTRVEYYTSCEQQLFDFLVKNQIIDPNITTFRNFISINNNIFFKLDNKKYKDVMKQDKEYIY